jgi:DNA-binding NarL/FixJ family response regulator
MPRLGGAELARRFRALHPEAVVVLMTGYAEGPLLGPGGVPEAAALIQKPAGLDEVAAVIRRLLDGAAERGAQAGA